MEPTAERSKRVSERLAAKPALNFENFAAYGADGEDLELLQVDNDAFSETSTPSEDDTPNFTHFDEESVEDEEDSLPEAAPSPPPVPSPGWPAIRPGMPRPPRPPARPAATAAAEGAPPRPPARPAATAAGEGVPPRPAARPAAAAAAEGVPPRPPARPAATAAAEGVYSFGWNARKQDTGPRRPVHTHAAARDRLDVKRGSLPADVSPLATFFTFLPESLWESIARHTSKRLVARGAGAVTVPELYDWLAVLIIMGYNELPSTKHYWDRQKIGLGNTAIPSIMSRNRWHLIKWCLTLVDDEKQSVPPSSPWFDRLHKASPVLAALHANLNKHVAHGKIVSLDEMMILCQGRTFIRIRMPLKPIKDGIKVH
jgi:hypothetical protein